VQILQNNLFQVTFPPISQRLTSYVRICPATAYPYVTGVTNYPHTYETGQQSVMSPQIIDPRFMTSQVVPQNADHQECVDRHPPYSE